MSDLPRTAGIGLRAPHVRAVRDERPPIGWLEVHSENYFADGGAALASLDRIAAHYPLSLHGVGLALGSVAPLDRDHLHKLARLVERVQPASVSEHLCWGAFGGRHFNDLLPLPYTSESLDHVCARVATVQDVLRRPILIENVSTYATFPESDIPEADFVAAVAARTGCGLLLDVNNVHVNARNHGLDAAAYLATLPVDRVHEIHLAGFDDSGAIVIDTHGARVAPPVWALYEAALARFGPVPTLIEWDTDIPPLGVLLDEAATAQALLDRCRADHLAMRAPAHVAVAAQAP
jgi:uncharacterized protein (UPF0276 family)